MIPKNWNETIARAEGSLLQSAEWGSLQERLGRAVRFVDDPATLLVSMPLPLGMRYEYAPHGPSGDTLHGENLHELVAHTHGVKTVFLRVEPRIPDGAEARAALAHAGFRRVPDVQPHETLYVDCSKNDDELLRAMEHDTRYAIRAAEKRGVTVEVAEGNARGAAFAEFWELFESTNVRHNLHSYHKRYYEELASLSGGGHTELFLARRENTTLAAAIVAYFGTRAYYLYAASREGYGKYNAPSLVLFSIMRRARAKGCRMIDLWGISSTKREWRGITAFKKSFGGVSCTFVGTWDYAYRPLWYRAYRLAARFR